LNINKIKLYRGNVDILADKNMRVSITKTQEENRKIVLDFYNYFNKNDRFLLKITDVNIVFDEGLLIKNISQLDDRYVLFQISGGLPEQSYEVDVIIMLSDEQVWKARLIVFIGYETGEA